MVKWLLIFGFVCFLIGAFGQTEARKYTVPQLQEDFNRMRSAFEESHAGLYRYNSKEDFDHYFDSLYSLITEPQTEIQFYRFLLPAICKIRCIHSSLNVSENYQESDLYFPVPIKIIGEKAYLDCDYSGLKFGSELVSINGLKTTTVLKTLRNLIPTDGFNQTFAPRIIEYKFPYLFKQLIQDTSGFDCEIIPLGSAAGRQIQLTAISADSLRKVSKTRHLYERYRKKPTMHHSLLNDSTALLTIDSFVDETLNRDGIKFAKYLKKFFKELSDKRIRHLVIDLRRNLGGTSANNPELFSYLTETPFNVFSSVEMNTTHPSFLQYTQYAGQEKKISKEWMESTNGKTETGKYRIEMENNVAPHRPIFTGRVYLLTSGLTVSTAARFTDFFSIHNRGLIFGEEPDGGYFGNNGGLHLPLTLPNTRLTTNIPLYKFTMAGELNKNWEGHGVQPDVMVTETIEEYIQMKDAGLDAVLKVVGD